MVRPRPGGGASEVSQYCACINSTLQHDQYCNMIQNSKPVYIHALFVSIMEAGIFHN